MNVMRSYVINKFSSWLALLVCGLLLSACGGGGGSPGATVGVSSGTGGVATASAKVTVTLEDQSGAAANLVSGAATLTVKATVLDSAGRAVPGVVVKFSSADIALVGVSPASGLTNTNGVAVATVTAASPSAAGATTILATSTFVDPATSATTVSLSGSANLQVGVAPQATPTTVELVSYIPTDRSILIKGNVGSGRSQTAQVTFKVTGNGQPIANQKVKFEFQPANADMTFASSSGVTGQGGEVTAIVNSGSTVTVAAVKVSVLDAAGNPTAIVATSDQLSVTNDTTSINGISLSSDIFYLEGWNVDGKEAALTARLTDKQGGQVTNGTVVTWTTDVGAITGLNNSAICQTLNGACSVKLVSQNPRPRRIATVTASVQVDGAIVPTDIHVLFSGSFATFTGNFNVDALATCDPQLIPFNLADSGGNMMPEGSKLSILSTSNATGKIIGQDTVRFAGTLSGGTTHVLEITPGATCALGGVNPLTGTVVMALTTPHGDISTGAATVKFKTN